jgi:DNA repair protein RadD
MILLRPYQAKMIEGTRAAYRQGHLAVLLNLPTGGGKTYTASTVVHGAAQKRNSVWWLTHRREIIAQASQTFYSMGIPHGTVQAGRVSDPNALVQVASIQTIAKRLDALPEPKLIVFDETHHIGAASWSSIFDKFPRARILGLTATPWRLDGAGLGRSLSPYRMFAPAIPDLSGVATVAGDYSRSTLSKAMDKPKIVGSAIQHYSDLCPGKRAVVFAAGVENSISIAAQFNAAGIRAEHVDGSMTADARDSAVARFRSGETLILSNSDLFGEGFDVPAIEACILLRPTKSLSLYLQQVGRALRPFEGKECAYLLDHAGNSLTHGLPDDVREWSLEDREKRKKGAPAEVVIRQCKECFYVYRPAPKCPACGHVPPVSAREIEQIEGTLQEITASTPVRDVVTLDGLRAVARARGYKRGWATHVFRERQASGRAA